MSRVLVQHFRDQREELQKGEGPFPAVRWEVLVRCHSPTLCVCTVWPGSILAEQGVSKGEAPCWEYALLFRELGEGAGLVLFLWILQKQVNFASSRKFTDVAEVLLAPAVMNWVSAMCSAGTAPLWSQLWLSFMQTPLTPKQSPFLFGSSSWPLKKKKINKNKSRIFLVKETKPTNQKPVGTLHEKWMVLHPRIKTNTGAKKRSSNLSSTQQKIRLHTKEKSLFLAALLPSSSTTSSLYSLKFTLQ